MINEIPSGIGKPLSKPSNLIQMSNPKDDPSEIELTLEEGDEGFVPENEDESVEIKIQEFSGNLAEDIDGGTLNKIGQDIVELVEEDQEGREKWVMEYKESLQYLGIKANEARSTPWQGACAVVAPLMLEGIVRFQSRAPGKLYPSNGPAVLSIK